MTREEAIKVLNMVEAYGLADEAKRVAIEALSEPNMIPIKLEKRYPKSRDEDITDAFMQGYLKGKADRSKGEWIKKQVFNPELDKYVPFIECSVCGYAPYYGGSEPKFNYCANCGADMKGGAE